MSAALQRRFGLALVFSAVLIASLAFAAYLDEPTVDLRPHRQQMGVLAHKASPFTPEGSAPRAQSLLDAFFVGLERNDDAAMRAVYPSLTRHDARVLKGIRRRLGQSARLRVDDLQLRSATTMEVAVDFTVLATSEGETRRLPFAATLNYSRDGWRITTLR